MSQVLDGLCGDVSDAGILTDKRNDRPSKESWTSTTRDPSHSKHEK